MVRRGANKRWTIGLLVNQALAKGSGIKGGTVHTTWLTHPIQRVLHCTQRSLHALNLGVDSRPKGVCMYR
jgi:hypothetical protein